MYIYYMIAVEKYRGKKLAHYPRRIESETPRYNTRSDENPHAVTWDYIYFSYESDANHFFSNTNRI